MGQLISRLISYFSKPKSTASSSSNIPVTAAAGTDASATANAPATSATGEKVYSWDLRKAVDPKDYTIENKKGETIVKVPGSINGNQFIIKNLENCIVFLFDNMAILSVDDCKNCKFFFGPSKGSVFIRNCTDCVLATLCQQFRTRDCKNVTTFIVCTSMPIIEASTQMKFGCLTLNYNALNYQLKMSNLSIFNSNWSTIHDFTRVPGQSNYITLDKSHKLENYLPYPEESIKNQLGVSFDAKDTIIPYSIGSAARTSDESCLVIFFFDPTNVTLISTNASNFVKAMSTIPDIWLVNSKNFNFSELSAENVFGTKDFNKFLQKGPIIGLEYNGHDSISICQAEAQKLQLTENHIYVSPPSPNLQQRIDNFYNFSDMQMFG